VVHRRASGRRRILRRVGDAARHGARAFHSCERPDAAEPRLTRPYWTGQWIGG
jgi:hypothetical protein